MNIRLVSIGILFSLFACGSSPALVDPGKSSSFFRQGSTYFYLDNNDSRTARSELKKVYGELIILAPTIAADQEKVYYKNNIQQVADRESFLADNNLYRDKNHVYSLGYFTLDIVPAADPSTFHYLDTGKDNEGLWAADKQRYFFRNKPVTTEFNSFQVLNQHLAFDSLHIYLADKSGLEIMGRIDGRIEKITAFFCRDKSSVYYFSLRTGFQKCPLAAGSRISIIRDEEISIDKNVHNIFR